MTAWETFGTFFNDYFVLIVATLLIVGYLVIDKILKNRKGTQGSKQSRLETINKILYEDSPAPVMTDPDAFNLQQFQDPEFKKQSPKNLFENIVSLSAELKLNSEEIESGISDDFNELKEKLRIVNERKEQIRFYGTELGKLYDQYRKREYHLTAVLTGMEPIVKQLETKEAKEANRPRHYKKHKKVEPKVEQQQTIN